MRCSLQVAVAAAMLVSAPASADEPASAGFEEPWLSGHGHLVVLRSRVDLPLGFHDVVVEVRRAQPDGTWRTVESRPLLDEESRRWYRSRGEYELFRAHQQRAKAVVARRFERRGYQPLLDLPVRHDACVARAERAEDNASCGRLELGEVSVSARVRVEAERSRVILEQSEYRFELVTTRPSAMDLGDGRHVRLDPARLRAARLTPDGNWVVFTVDSIAPLHPGVAPERQIVVIPTALLLEALGLPAGHLESDAVT